LEGSLCDVLLLLAVAHFVVAQLFTYRMGESQKITEAKNKFFFCDWLQVREFSASRAGSLSRRSWFVRVSAPTSEVKS